MERNMNEEKKCPNCGHSLNKGENIYQCKDGSGNSFCLKCKNPNSPPLQATCPHCNNVWQNHTNIKY